MRSPISPSLTSFALAVAFATLPVSAQAAPGKALKVVIGLSHTCALLESHQVKCWGSNNQGQLGAGDTRSHGGAPADLGTALPAVPLGIGRTAIDLSVGDNHSCALLDNGSVKCWGRNDRGQLGTGDTRDRGGTIGDLGDALPAVNLGRAAVALSLGDEHSCALLDNHEVKCWGNNQFGQLGVGDSTDRGGTMDTAGAITAINLGTGRTALQLGGGYYHACAILDDHSLKCWGRNEYGQLGTGDTNNRGDKVNQMGDQLMPIPLGAGRTALQVSLGEDFSCALLDDLSIKCWGHNQNGQLGKGDSTDRGGMTGQMGDMLAAIDLEPGLMPMNLGCGGDHCCVVFDVAHTTKCWGQNGSGQLGSGDSINHGDKPNQMGFQLPFVNLGSLASAKALTMRESHTCAILADDSVKCWGSNDNGQLGTGDTKRRGQDPNSMGDGLRAVEF